FRSAVGAQPAPADADRAGLAARRQPSDDVELGQRDGRTRLGQTQRAGRGSTRRDGRSDGGGTGGARTRGACRRSPPRRGAGAARRAVAAASPRRAGYPAEGVYTADTWHRRTASEPEMTLTVFNWRS